MRFLHNLAQWTQFWYAVDASSVYGHLENIDEWSSVLSSQGPDFNYFPEPSKSFLPVSEKHRSAA